MTGCSGDCECPEPVVAEEKEASSGGTEDKVYKDPSEKRVAEEKEVYLAIMDVVNYFDGSSASKEEVVTTIEALQDKDLPIPFKLVKEDKEDITSSSGGTRVMFDVIIEPAEGQLEKRNMEIGLAFEGDGKLLSIWTTRFLNWREFKNQ